MASQVQEAHEDLQPRSLRFLAGAWLLFLLYSAYKGMKFYWWPRPLTYRGVTVVLLTGVVVYLFWRLGRDGRWKAAWLRLLQGEIAPAILVKETRQERTVSAIWFVIGLVFLGGSLGWLEYREPYFFTQDDNLSQFLPVILQGCASFFSTGELVTYNAHQFAGAPTASIGTYALTYPGTYLSYWIAREALGSPAATIDVFCILHLTYGYPVLFSLLRRMGCGPGIATAGALSFLLQGFFLINGRSWFYMAPTALWVPVLFLLAERLRQGLATRIWPLGAGLVIGAYFHSGNVQMWVYGMAIWVMLLASWMFTGKLAWRAALPIFGSLLVGLGIALPLFVPQFVETASAKRIIDGAAIDWTLAGLYLPWPLFRAETSGPALFGTENREYIGQFMYSGTTFMVIATLVGISLVVHRWTRKTWGENAYAPLAVFVFAAALGQMGLVWFVFSKLPIFSKFAHPFKCLPLLTFLAVLCGGVALERWLRTKRRRTSLEMVFSLATLGLLAYHVSLPLPSAFTYGFKPFLRPFESLRDASGPPQRVIALAPYRHGAAAYGRMPVNNLPTVQGLYSLIGYDPIVMRREPAISMLGKLGHVETYNSWGNWLPSQWREAPLSEEEKSQRIAALRAYGVDTVFSFGSALRPPYEKGKLTYIFYRGDQYLWQLLEAVRGLPESERKVVANTPWGVTYRITGADPLAFLERDRASPQTIRFTAQGAVVELQDAGQGDVLIVNLIDDPGNSFLRTYVDGELVSHEVDSWMRVRIPLNSGSKKIEIRYEPPFLKWLLAGVPLIGIGACLGFWKPRRTSS
jgi:hypothetical protein